MSNQIPESVQAAIIQGAAIIGGKSLDKMPDSTDIIRRMPEVVNAAMAAFLKAYDQQIVQGKRKK